MAVACNVIEHAACYRFAAPPEEVWDAMGRLDQFERWWGWLGHFQAEGGGLRTGAVLRGVVAPPVPYTMQVVVELQRCVPCRLVDALVSGDLAGDAHLTLERSSEGTVAGVAWSLEMRQMPMRVAARLAYPLLRWGHDRVVESTVGAFGRHVERQG
jgi:hypothetical protein